VQQHLISYPIISDSVTTFRANAYGAKYLALTSAGMETFGKPLLTYLSKSYQYVSPYVQRADSLGDLTLSILDSRFPAVKKQTGELYHEGRSIIFFPLNKGSKGKNYMFTVYGNEKRKFGRDGLVGYGMATIGTVLVASGDAYKWVSEFLASHEAEVKEVQVVDEKF
jgi:hypothetical protein